MTGSAEARMTTFDFELEIGPGVAGSYPVAARAPGGEAVSTLRWLVNPVELDHQLAVIKDKVLVSSAAVRRAPTADERPVRELGQRLFEVLIADDVRALYVASRQRAQEDGAALRLVLRVRPPELVRLPWEFLFDPAQQDYLGLTVPLVRYPQVLAPRRPLQVSAPLRILGMVARPDDQRLLDTGEERQRLQAALAVLQRQGLVELVWVAGQTYRDLEDALDCGPWHIFHFVGHGGYDRLADEGTLALAGETGRTQLIGADDISRLLAEHHPLRLVVLNACDTGRGSASDAFSSTAAALIRRAIPAVVAMQFEITDGAAIQFAQTFYEYVATGRPVDDSVMRARRALRQAKNDTLEWGTPVLYLRAPDGRIFDTTLPPPPQPASFPDPAPTPEALTPEVAATPRTPARRQVSDPRSPPPAVHNPGLVQTVRYWKAVTAVAFSPDGRLLAAACDNTAQVWDAGVTVLTVVHRGWLLDHQVCGVAFSPDGHRLATASEDRTARIWEAVNGQKRATVTHDGAVRAVVFSSDGRQLATASDDGTARIWDAVSGQERARVTHDGAVRGVAFSPDGSLLATASDDKTAAIWALSDDE